MRDTSGEFVLRCIIFLSSGSGHHLRPRFLQCSRHYGLSTHCSRFVGINWPYCLRNRHCLTDFVVLNRLSRISPELLLPDWKWTPEWTVRGAVSWGVPLPDIFGGWHGRMRICWFQMYSLLCCIWWQENIRLSDLVSSRCIVFVRIDYWCREISFCSSFFQDRFQPPPIKTHTSLSALLSRLVWLALCKTFLNFRSCVKLYSALLI